MRHQLDQPGINQDPRADSVKHAIDHQPRLAAGRIHPANAQPDGNGHGSRERVPHRHIVGGITRAGGRRAGEGGDGQAGPETEAFEGLVEGQHDVEGGEFGAGDGEGQADEDGVEYHAEFEDEDGRHLRGGVFGGAGGGGGGGGRGVGACVAEVVVAGGVGRGGVFGFEGLDGGAEWDGVGVGVVFGVVGVGVGVGVGRVGEAHGH